MTGSLLFVGECMMEIRNAEKEGIKHSFAGDSYNSAVYAKRWFKDHRVAFYSSLGDDPISEMMLASWQSENIDCSLVCKSDHRLPGIYAISIDELGERKFSYWRKDSAATEMMKLLDQNGRSAALGHFDCVYFSGISLAILSDDCKERLLTLVAKLRSGGTAVAFDPNYRESLWADESHARSWIKRAYRCCDIALSGLEEHEQLFAHHSVDDVNRFLNALGVKEIVIKGGGSGVYAFAEEDLIYHKPFCAAPRQVDTTAAGDSFAGTYLAARVAGWEVSDAVDSATEVAREVVQHCGAIVDEKLTFWERTRDIFRLGA